MRTMMWFRADLRVGDNPALAHAAQRGEVVGVFVVCPEQWTRHDWSGVKVDFILRTLEALKGDLAKLRIPLRVLETARFDGVPALLSDEARRTGCAGVVFNREYEVNEVARDEAVVEAFERAGLSARSFLGEVLVEPGTVRTGEGRYYTVFTAFKRALYKALGELGLEEVGAPAAQKKSAVEATDVPRGVKGFAVDGASKARGVMDAWPAGEAAARARLERFVRERVDGYARDRDAPAVDGTSSLSAYLSVGAISARSCVRAALGANGGVYDGGSEGASVWISELAWREFYKHILVGYPRVCKHRAFRVGTERIVWSDNDEHFLAWCEGRTGVPIVDAAMRCLVGTGWMHNRLRMVTAMYLTKDLFIDWRRGERFFMRHLIDGDLAANNGGWQWSASTGTDAAPYFRVFNPVSQSRRFDPEGAFIRRWVAELRDLEGGERGAIHDPGELPGLQRSRLEYPEALVDRAASLERVKRAFVALTQ